MKKYSIKFIYLLLALTSLGLSSCLKDTCKDEQTFYQYIPVYKSLQQLRSEFEVQEPKELKTASKIYVYGDYLFINEEKEGIHIYNNSDPKHPIQILFLNIPGNVDLAIKNDVLYADNYVDLIAIDISNIQHPKLLCRQENVFSPLLVDPTRGLLVDYQKTEMTIKISCSDYRYNLNYWYSSGPESEMYVKRDGGVPTAPGIGGSTARFTILNDFLYTVDQSSLYSFQIVDKCTQLKNKLNIGWNIETIFPFQENLFIGSTSGMFIYSVNNPALPLLLANVQHMRSCDPVVANEQTAYVTLRGGSACGGYTNQLDIIDIRNITSASIVSSYPLSSPTGLALDENLLYICDDGLKVLNVQRQNIRQIAHIKGINPHDVIVVPSIKTLIAVSQHGVSQYNIANPESPELLSTLNTK